jgi:hypothetical protein
MTPEADENIPEHTWNRMQEEVIHYTLKEACVLRRSCKNAYPQNRNFCYYFFHAR